MKACSKAAAMTLSVSAAALLMPTAACSGRPAGGAPDAGPVPAAPERVWPNEESAASSDPWIALHHAELREMRPRVLALNFVNAKTNGQMREQLRQVIDDFAEASRYHGYSNPDAPVFLRYQLAYLADLRDDPPPAGWRYNNSTRYPRQQPRRGTWGFDYGALFTQEFAQLLAIEDPAAPGRVLDLCALVERGLVHDVWVYADGDVADEAGAAEVLAIQPRYDSQRRRLPGPMNRCAGNGCFDDEDAIPSACTRTLRIAFFNHTRGPGCFMESLSHGFESMGAWNPDHIPSLSRDFVPFAGYAMDRRYGLPFDSWYACNEPRCLSYPTPTSVRYRFGGYQGTISPYDPVCGNVHFAPNARENYDLESPFAVDTTCTSFGLRDGPDGRDAGASFTVDAFARYREIASDCQGPFLVWWRQNFPGLDTTAIGADGEPILNWWPYLYY